MHIKSDDRYRQYSRRSRAERLTPFCQCGPVRTATCIVVSLADNALFHDKTGIAVTYLNDGFLDLAEARHLRDKSPESLGGFVDLDLSAYTRATSEALEFLSNQGGNSVVCLGVTGLDKMSARVLVGWDAFFCFLNLESLDVEVAAILSAGSNSLGFESESLRTISPDVARELARLNGLLSLGLDSISDDVAYELVAHTHELLLQLKTPPSRQILLILTGHAGHLLHITWESRHCDALCNISSGNKKVSVYRRSNELTGQIFEHVYICNSDFHTEDLSGVDASILDSIR